MRIKCPHCNGKGFSEINSAFNLTCGWCMGQGELDLEIVPIEPQTNDDIDVKEPMRDWGVCKDCALKENCAEYKPYKRQCEDYESVPKTNEDWIHSMSAEDFADWLMETFDLCGAGCSNCFVKEMCFVDNEIWPTEMMVKWLKQPHREE